VVATRGPERNHIRRYSLAVDVVIWVLVGVISLVTLYPFVYILSMSISDPLEVASGSVWLLPRGFSLKAYGEIIASERIVRSFFNSVLYVVTITFLCVLNSLVAGNSLAKSTLLFRKGIVIYILIPMFVGAGLIPTFIVMTRLGMFNTLWAIYLPAMVSIWNIILARTFIAGLPHSLREAAYIDGATETQVLRLIVLPLSKPIIAVLSLYEAIGVWNMWLNFQIYMPAAVQWHPLQMVLTQSLLWGDVATALQLDPNIDPDTIKEKLKLAAVGAQLKYAVVIVATAPVMAIYPFVQKYFTQGVMLGSLKG
jgi:putative aldouronate transport system permease protein